MTDAFLTLLPYLPAAPVLVALAAITTRLYRLWTAAVKQLQDERADHEATNAKLDAERETRRKVEDRMNEQTWQVRALKAEVARLQARAGESP